MSSTAPAPPSPTATARSSSSRARTTASRPTWSPMSCAASRSETGLAVTLSLGERPDEDLAAWREAGRRPLPPALRDLRRRALPAHPPRPPRPASDRSPILRTLQRLGYEAGSGIMVGIPGQTYASVADDIDLFRGMDLDMIGIGPYLPHPADAAGRRVRAGPPDRRPSEQIAGRRAHGLQGRRPHPARAARAEHPEHDGARDHQQGRRTRTGAHARREHRHAQPHAAGVPREATRSILTRRASTRPPRCAGAACKAG